MDETKVLNTRMLLAAVSVALMGWVCFDGLERMAAYFKELPLWEELRPRIMKETDPDAVMTLLRETREEKNGS